MNEALFFGQVFIVMLFALIALRIGREALIVWVVLQALLANLFVMKQMHFFGFEITCSDVYAIGSVLGLNLLQEYFGKESATKALWISFYTMIFFALMSQLHLLYFPSVHDTAHSAFETILSSTPRFLLASVAVFFIVQAIDFRFFGALKNYLPSSSFWPRNLLSLSITQLIDTVLFTFIALYGIAGSLTDIMIVSYLIKLIVIFCTTPFTALSKRFNPSPSPS